MTSKDKELLEKQRKKGKKKKRKTGQAASCFNCACLAPWAMKVLISKVKGREGHGTAGNYKRHCVSLNQWLSKATAFYINTTSSVATKDTECKGCGYRCEECDVCVHKFQNTCFDIIRSMSESGKWQRVDNVITVLHKHNLERYDQW